MVLCDDLQVQSATSELVKGAQDMDKKYDISGTY
jgi:hypothetical protein